ncbi:MAG: hypothetical protein F6J86_37270 [Symploca sp. SIO1B1]|nr:hypothetical protein [Symploca sp. SIO2D2]NER45976.1 hypothetical protein [Symploca sp. SIO1A3]NER99409.1 hypothetical protein [Symploca sp. SIO1B1]NET58820.1 hypothetical protein [Symploca sp. SIO2E6]
MLLIEITAWITAFELIAHLVEVRIMNFDEYQQQTEGTFQAPPSLEARLSYLTWALGVSAKAGELTWRVTELINHEDGILDYQSSVQITETMGFLLWNMARLASEFGIELNDIAVSNLQRISNLNNP